MPGCKDGSKAKKPLTMKGFFDGLAPRWDSLEESTNDKLREFLKILNIKEGDKILDIACGTGIISPLLEERSKADVLAIDLSSKMIEIAQRKFGDHPHIRFECLDYLDLKETGFDMAVCFNAYPHFLDVPAFVEKTNQVLSKGGCFAILHNINRKGMDHCHEGEGMEAISRSLSTPEEEAEPFKKYFDILLAKEDEKSYLIIGRKR